MKRKKKEARLNRIKARISVGEGVGGFSSGPGTLAPAENTTNHDHLFSFLLGELLKKCVL